MVDVDGVVVRNPHGERWDRTLASDLGLEPSVLRARFFTPFFAAIVLAQEDLHERLASVLGDIAPALGSETLTDYWFSHDAHLDDALIAGLQEVRRRGWSVHLATTQEHYRADYLWNAVGLRELFDDIHYSAAMGVAKPDPAFYRAVERRTGRLPAELLLLDDREENVAAAVAAGWSAHLWTPASSLADIEGLIECADHRRPGDD